MRDIANKVDNVDVLSGDEFNSYMKELENGVSKSGIVLDPAGGADTSFEMLAQSITRHAQGAQSYQDSGTANTYVLSAVGGFKQSSEYIGGMVVLFKAGSSNTGASTINVSSLGVVDLKDNNGVNIVAGSVIAGNYYFAQYDSTDDEFRLVNFGGVNSSSNDFLHIQDQKTAGVNGGSKSAGVDTRVLNTVLTNDITGASLSQNQITLPIGVYYIDSSCPAFSGNQNEIRDHKAYLYDTTNSSDVVVGTSERIEGNDSGFGVDLQTRSFISGRFELTVPSDLEVRHYSTEGNALDGLGRSTSSGQVEIYTDVKIWKVG